MFQSLITSRKFAPLFWCQFFSALNDNFVKNALVILILFKIGGSGGRISGDTGRRGAVAPFFFLSALGGELADKYDKAELARAVEARRDPGGDHCRARLLVCNSVPVLFVALGLLRRHRRAVRADQIRHPARPSRQRRNCRPATRWSKARRSLAILDRHNRRRPDGAIRKARRWRIAGRRRGAVGRSAGWPRASSRRRALRRPNLVVDQEPAGHRPTLCSTRSARRRPPVDRRSHHELVLAGRRGRAVAAAGHCSRTASAATQGVITLGLAGVHGRHRRRLDRSPRRRARCGRTWRWCRSAPS